MMRAVVAASSRRVSPVRAVAHAEQPFSACDGLNECYATMLRQIGSAWFSATHAQPLRHPVSCAIQSDPLPSSLCMFRQGRTGSPGSSGVEESAG